MSKFPLNIPNFLILIISSSKSLYITVYYIATPINKAIAIHLLKICTYLFPTTVGLKFILDGNEEAISICK